MVGRVNEGSLAYHLGQIVGDGGAVIQGTVEVAVGGAGEVGGTGLIFTGVGAPANVAVDVVSTGAIVHGGATGLTGVAHLGKALVTAFSGSSESGSTGASQGSGNSPAVDKALDTIDKGGFNVKANPKTPNQEGNVTITHPNKPGSKLKLESRLIRFQEAMDSQFAMLMLSMSNQVQKIVRRKAQISTSRIRS